MKRLLFVCACVLFSCSNTKKNTKRQISEYTLNFKDCYVEKNNMTDLDYEKIKVFLPKKNVKIEKIESHGFCEYQFLFKNGEIFYITTDIYNGSKLNSKNLFEIRKEIYFKNRSLATDTIKNSGRNEDKHWSENILGNIVLGYVNITEDDKKYFDEAILTFKRR